MFFIEYKTHFGRKVENRCASKKLKNTSLKTKKKNAKLSITYQHLTIVLDRYSHFGDFINIVKPSIESFLTQYTPVNLKRLGLRYS